MSVNRFSRIQDTRLQRGIGKCLSGLGGRDVTGTYRVQSLRRHPQGRPPFCGPILTVQAMHRFKHGADRPRPSRPAEINHHGFVELDPSHCGTDAYRPSIIRRASMIILGLDPSNSGWALDETSSSLFAVPAGFVERRAARRAAQAELFEEAA